MNDLLRDTLAERARTVEPPQLDLDALVRRGERRLRRRRHGLVAGTALVVALVVATPTLLADLRDQPAVCGATGPGRPTRDPEPDPRPASRPLVWAEGLMLHLGDREIEIGFTPPFREPGLHAFTKDSLVALRATDDGAVFATLDGGIRFSDGRSTAQVGGVGGTDIRSRSVSYLHGRPESWISANPTGSWAVWVEFPNEGRLRSSCPTPRRAGSRCLWLPKTGPGCRTGSWSPADADDDPAVLRRDPADRDVTSLLLEAWIRAQYEPVAVEPGEQDQAAVADAPQALRRPEAQPLGRCRPSRKSRVRTCRWSRRCGRTAHPRFPRLCQ